MDPEPGTPQPKASWTSMAGSLDLEDLLDELRGRASAARHSQQRLGSLLDAVVAVSSDLDLTEVLARIVRAACQVTGARYGALGVLAPEGDGLSEFITHGLDADQRAVIGDLPHGHGILGLIIRDPRPLRLPDLAAHPDSFGFPPNHPPMRSFLGAPVRIRGEVYGNLYLTEKLQAEQFDEDDETILVALAAAAGVAIDNARLFERSRQQTQWSEAAGDLTRTLLEREDEEGALRLLAGQVRALSGAAVAVVAIADAEGVLRVRAANADPELSHLPLASAVGGLLGTSVEGTDWVEAQRSPRPVPFSQKDTDGLPPTSTPRLTDLALHVPAGRGVALRLGPVGHTSAGLGVVAIVWTGGTGGTDWATSLATLSHYTQQASVALLAAWARRDFARLARLEDRDRIARDMHDHVIQRLFATGLSLQSAGRMSQQPTVRSRLDEAVDDLDGAIRDIRQTIYELHQPAASDGWQEDLTTTTEAFTHSLGFAPELHVEGGEVDLPASLRADVVAVVREGLANVARHAQASRAVVRVRVDGPDRVGVEVVDDGVGIVAGSARSGLLNLGRRATARSGSFEVRAADPCGTVICWQVGSAGGPPE